MSFVCKICDKVTKSLLVSLTLIVTRKENTVSQDEVTASNESVVDSQEAESVTETDSDKSGSESDAGLDAYVSSSTTSYDKSEEYGYDSGDEEEWTLYRDLSIPLTHEPGDVPQRVIKETKRAGKKFYLVEFAALPRYGYNIEYSKNWTELATVKLLKAILNADHPLHDLVDGLMSTGGP
ncbi:Crystallin, lambda 1 [Branchiostoma belcheri]|nr:Crystallin, lambda 1 [Branchiostoma belcheri]